VLPAFLSVPASAGITVQPAGGDPLAVLPSARPQRYQIRPGDTLSLIAGRLYGSPAWWPQLWRQNHLGDPRSLIAGTWLSIDARWPHRPKVPGQFLPKPAPSRAALAAPPAPPAPAAPAPAPVTAGSGFEACVIQAESGGDPRAYNSSSGASGLYGFLLSTWDSLGLGYPGGAYTAPPSVQHQGFEIEFARAGTAPWRPYDGC